MIYRRRVHFYETDAQGVVHHSNYFRYLEEARDIFLRKRGYPYSKLRDEGFEVVLLETRCVFKKPLYFDDLFEIHLTPKEITRFTFSFDYKIFVNNELKATAYTKHCVVKDNKIVSIPGELLRELQGS